jgi:EAL domain-containing protein (putative c-di-GMP-specific phosphodiesterase class I)/DNA-binding NarL/FixJ family response regulator
VDRIRLMVADDEAGVRRTLTELVAADPSIELVGVATTADEAIELAGERCPDVALIDLRMPGGGTTTARRLRRAAPETKVVVLSVSAEADDVLAMLRAGAIGYVSKDMSAERILDAIHRSAEGHAAIALTSLDEVAERLAEFLAVGAHAHRRSVVARIREVIDGRGIDVVFQPIVDLDGGSVVGMEALSRFRAPPPRTPDAWFAEAATVGLRTELELTAIALALGELGRIPDDASLWINASPATLAKPALGAALAGAPAHRLVVEMTEHAPVEDYAQLRRALRPLRAQGVALAIDDVGTGFASLGHIVCLGPDHVKLDRTLIASIDRDPTRRALVERLVSFADEIGVGLVAEGVETPEELATLRSLGVRRAQGFHLGVPTPARSHRQAAPRRRRGARAAVA